MADCPLTRTQREILEGIAAGLTYKQIADQRNRSVSTIGSTMATVFRRLGVTDRAQAVLAGYRAGWLQPSLPAPAVTPSRQLLIDVRDSLQRLEQRLPLNRWERDRLAQFEQGLRTAEPGDVRDRMLANLDAVLRHVDRHGHIPARNRRPRPTDAC